MPLLTNHDVTTQTQALGGCSDFMASPTAGVDNPAALTNSNDPGDFNLGPGPYSPEAGAVAGDTVLRTGSLSLGIETGSGFSNANSPVGESGGRANLFGAPAGKPQVDVKINLITDINSLLREVDGANRASTPATTTRTATSPHCSTAARLGVAPLRTTSRRRSPAR